MEKEEKRFLTVKEAKYPVFIYRERRYGARASFGKKGILVRIPQHANISAQEKMIEEMLSWATDYLLKKAPVIEKPLYKNGQIFICGGEEFKLQISENPLLKDFRSKLDVVNKIINIKTPPDVPEIKAQKHIAKLLKELMEEYFFSYIDTRLRILNERYIKKEITKVSLRDASTRWGSCSIDGKVMISTRLLLAPKWVMDYVLIHELCHLVHPDHSVRFWRLVGSIYPEYKKAMQHLNEFGLRYRF